MRVSGRHNVGKEVTIAGKEYKVRGAVDESESQTPTAGVAVQRRAAAVNETRVCVGIAGTHYEGTDLSNVGACGARREPSGL